MTGSTKLSRLALHFARVNGQTRLTHVRQEPPWKIVRAFSNDAGAAFVHLHNVSGGVLSGDQLEASIDLGAGSEAQITTTGSTRIYRAREGAAAASQQLEATVGDGALLEYVPDSVIPFGGSRYRQISKFELGQEAGLFAWEVIAPGRTGERFAFDDLAIRTELRGCETLIALEAWSAQPHLRALANVIRLGRFPYQAAFYICRTGLVQEHWMRWERTLAELLQTLDSSRQSWGVSMLPGNGLIFRGLASEALYLHETLIRFWRWMKRELYGREAVLPRKTF